MQLVLAKNQLSWRKSNHRAIGKTNFSASRDNLNSPPLIQSAVGRHQHVARRWPNWIIRDTDWLMISLSFDWIFSLSAFPWRGGGPNRNFESRDTKVLGSTGVYKTKYHYGFLPSRHTGVSRLCAYIKSVHFIGWTALSHWPYVIYVNLSLRWRWLSPQLFFHWLHFSRFATLNTQSAEDT